MPTICGVGEVSKCRADSQKDEKETEVDKRVPEQMVDLRLIDSIEYHAPAMQERLHSHKRTDRQTDRQTD